MIILNLKQMLYMCLWEQVSFEIWIFKNHQQQKGILGQFFQSRFHMMLLLGGNTSHHLTPKGVTTKLQLTVGIESLQQ